MKISLIIFILTLSGCSVDSVKNEFRIFYKHKNNNYNQRAYESLNKIISLSNDNEVIKRAYLEMADLKLEILKSPESKINMYKKLSNLSDNLIEKNEYKYLVSRIYLENLSDFDRAISEAKKINLENSHVDEYVKVKKILVNAYKNKKNYFQALIELESIFKKGKISDKDFFDLKLIKAGVFSLEKKHDEAILVYNQLMKKYPSKAISEKIYLNVLTNYEAIGAYDRAIKLLENYKNKHKENNQFIVSKLKRLNDLRKNMPGAKGLRR